MSLKYLIQQLSLLQLENLGGTLLDFTEMEGRQEGEVNLLVRLLTKRFGPLFRGAGVSNSTIVLTTARKFG